MEVAPKRWTQAGGRKAFQMVVGPVQNFPVPGSKTYST
jgi:hypothetical protein